MRQRHHAVPRATPFEDNAAQYDAWFEMHFDSYQAELEALRSLLPAGGRGVEIGVGTGRFAASLGIPVGVEPSSRMAELARGRGIEVMEGVAESLPFPDNSFDFALMVTVVCFLDDVSRGFRETWRILKPGGTLVIGFIDRESALGRIYSQNKEQSVFYRDARFHSVNEVVMLLARAGFSDFSYRQTLLPDETTHFTILEGFGAGSFIAVQARKQEQ